MNHEIIHRAIRQFRRPFLADFDRLTEQDIQTILAGPSETLLAVLHRRYGYSRAEAIRVWNEFVLRRVDGQENTSFYPSVSSVSPVA